LSEHLKFFRTQNMTIVNIKRIVKAGSFQIKDLSREQKIWNLAIAQSNQLFWNFLQPLFLNKVWNIKSVSWVIWWCLLSTAETGNQPFPYFSLKRYKHSILTHYSIRLGLSKPKNSYSTFLNINLNIKYYVHEKIQVFPIYTGSQIILTYFLLSISKWKKYFVYKQYFTNITTTSSTYVPKCWFCWYLQHNIGIEMCSLNRKWKHNEQVTTD